MTEANRQRPVIDLDELERQLREAAGPRPAARPVSAPAHDDPLAELARIVGQDDPFRALWADRGGDQQQVAQRVEPAMDPHPVPAPSVDSFEEQLAVYESGEQPRSNLPYQLRQPAAQPDPDQDWDYRPSHDQQGIPRPTHAAYDDRYAQAEAEPVFEAEGQLPPHDEHFAEEPQPKRRKGLMVVGAILGVAGIGVAGAFALKGGAPQGVKVAGGPPLIMAEAGPAKVQPQNPGGVDVPNQDRQIYSRPGAPEDLKGVKVSGRTEQPVDVAQITRRDLPAEAPRPVSATSTNPAGDSALPKPPQVATGLPALGEPRRVKTVAVRPDGTVIDADAGANTRVASLGSIARPGAPAAAAPAVSDASASASGATPAPVPNPRPRMTVPTTTGTALPKPKPATPETTATMPVVPAAPVATAPAAPPAPRQQVASTQPTAAPAELATAATGGFAVQLAAPQSEAEARDAISRLSKRFAGELGDAKLGVRKADVNGKTIWRIRTGGLSQADASALCSKVQGAGGQCFVAKN